MSEPAICYTYPQPLTQKSAASPGSNFNQQGGSIFNQRRHGCLALPLCAALPRSVRVDCRVALSALEQLIKREADVFGDLTEQDWGNVSTLMKRHRGAAAGGIAELFVGTALANFGEAESEKNGYDFIGFEDGNIAHGSSYGNVLNSNELGLQRGFAVF